MHDSTVDSVDQSVHVSPQMSSQHSSIQSSPLVNSEDAISFDITSHSSLIVVSDSNQDSKFLISDMWQNMPPDCDTLVNLAPKVDLESCSNDHFLRKSTREHKRPAWWNDYQC